MHDDKKGVASLVALAVFVITATVYFAYRETTTPCEVFGAQAQDNGEICVKGTNYVRCVKELALTNELCRTKRCIENNTVDYQYVVSYCYTLPPMSADELNADADKASNNSVLRKNITEPSGVAPVINVDRSEGKTNLPIDSSKSVNINVEVSQ